MDHPHGEHIQFSEEALRKAVDEEARLAILCALEMAPGRTLNHEVLYAYLPKIGFVFSMVRLRANIDFLREVDLVRLRHNRSLMILEITQTGSDVTKGSYEATGVSKAASRGSYLV